METAEKTIGRDMAEATPKRVFIEIGTSVNPVTYIGKKHFEENDTYIGIDVEGHKTREAKLRTDLVNKGADNLHFLSADAESLPLADKSADEIYFGNVFGWPQPDENLNNLLTESWRVLKDGGRIVIKETITPPNDNKIEGLLSANGFVIEKIIKPRDDDWEKEIAQYDLGSRRYVSSPSSRLLYIRKKEQ